MPAPIKQAYIWDLAPEVSVVQQCLRHHLRVYLLQWKAPGADEQGVGLAEYASRSILACLRVIEAETGQRQVFLAGHSLGGTLAALFSALHPDRVRGLALLEAPLHFGQAAGVFAPLIVQAPRMSYPPTAVSRVPGSFLSMVSLLAAPITFGSERWIDWFNSLPDAEARRTHLLVERWALDELPLPS